ncbi:MAG: hypothetical protein GWO02_00880, partial [Gammaproteobacteria bacterium]|nr:hypothetical protein [Gammaproteobacteria bacterium]
MSLEHLMRMLLREARARKAMLVGVFVIVSLGMLGTGVIWPETYKSSTTILVEEENIIRPLMEGAAVPTGVVDRARIAKEVIFSRRLMSRLIEAGEWETEGLTQVERETLIENVRARTTLSNVGRNLIRIEYEDNDPMRAFHTTKRYAEFFIEESLAAKQKESEDAFNFIDNQVREYHEKLMAAEQRLKEFRSENLDAHPSSEGTVAERIASLESRIEATRLELKEKRIQRRSLVQQLSGEAEVTESLSQEGKLKERLADLKAQRDDLRLSYHDTHPDIAQLNLQIGELTKGIKAEQRRREAAKATASAEGDTFIDDGVALSPLYEELRRRLADAKTDIVTLETRLAEMRAMREAERGRAKQIESVKATLAELNRDYEVNRDIYQDLLRRRENARVSMNIDKEGQGLTLEIQEPAAMPVVPSGLGFRHFAGGGLLLGLVLPVGLLLGLVQVDPRVRDKNALIADMDLPLLGTVPHYTTTAERRWGRLSVVLLGAVVLGDLGIYAWVGWLKYTG